MEARTTVTVSDSNQGSATAIIEVNPDTGLEQVVEVTVVAGNGQGVNFGLLHSLMKRSLPGLSESDAPDQGPNGAGETGKPAAKTTRAASAARKSATKATGKAKAPRGKAQDEPAGRTYRISPSVDALQEAYRIYNGNVAGMAEHFDVPKHSVTGWLRRHRAAGVAFGSDEA
jgi:hypothetical protein